MIHTTQAPHPGEFLRHFCGDVIRFTLTVPSSAAGTCWLRTNVGRAAVRHDEVVRHVEHDRPIWAGDWHDVEMVRESDELFGVSVPLTEVGVFEAKAFFLRDGSTEPVWPGGRNTTIKVEPSDTCCANTIYTAFVRQFGESCTDATAPDAPEHLEQLETAGYTTIPPSGKFRGLIRRLDFIMGELGFRIIQLLPIHPVPTTYARMGRFGSPYAALDFMDVDPALAEFDRQTTPLDQFRELVDAVHLRRGKLLIDIPLNHTGWASVLQNQHPEWFVRGADATFQSPGAWGVTWEDLSELDFRHRKLWNYMADVLLFWCRQGVDGFRCDAGYMIPVRVWEYITAKVRDQFPDTVFLLEGLGGKIETMELLLSRGGLTWAYSELFQNYDRPQVNGYLPGCLHISSTKGTLVHFAETHDNSRLAARSHGYARLRTALAALFSDCGAFGITNGVEWFAAVKLDVHGAMPLNWGAAENQTDHIKRLATLLRTHPAFGSATQLHTVACEASHSVALRRSPPDAADTLFVVANLAESQPDEVSWSDSEYPSTGPALTDLLAGTPHKVWQHGGRCGIRLGPGQVVCLASTPDALPRLEAALAAGDMSLARIEQQRARARALRIHTHFQGLNHLEDAAPDMLTAQMLQDPAGYCAALAGRQLAPVTHWQWPRDLRRIVPVPPEWFVLVRAEHDFHAELRDGDHVLFGERACRADDGSYFVLVPPLRHGPLPCTRELALTVFEGDGCRRERGQLRFVSTENTEAVQRAFSREQVKSYGCFALATNGCGAMSQVQGAWSELHSQYDAVLAANIHPDFPVDRRILLTRCRAWLVNRGYSQTINKGCLAEFAADENEHVTWSFSVPAGMGKTVPLEVVLGLSRGRNAVTLEFRRLRGRGGERLLDDDTPVKIIVRPDVEDRNCHETTKAYTGPETTWPSAVRPRHRGFSFSPYPNHCLRMAATRGEFTSEPEWHYMVPHPFEAERGLEGSSDLFSPGYFTLTLKGGQTAVLRADVAKPSDSAGRVGVPVSFKPGPSSRCDMLDSLRTSMRAFLAKRDDSLTVIAGYPWFLDWGRDTLICLRGYIAAGYVEEATEVLRQFGRFEANGTLPNMIRGDDDSNRDTSDAPLWFFVACRDLVAELGTDLLDMDCDGRSLAQVLRSIANSYRRGTPNGIGMDPDSGLIFSPPHFTWMDTNHPTGTPRQGYPVEIQALWHAALRFLAEHDDTEDWAGQAEQVRRAIQTHFFSADLGFLSDCLHARPGQRAAQAHADDHLRPNQLFAVTLGAVECPTVCAGILAACEELLVPGAIRSLADRPVSHALPVRRHGALLNDQHAPYWGTYKGDEDTRRKPAYHNGTAWTWVFPSYSEALYHVYGEEARQPGIALLNSALDLLNRACIGHMPEIVDGNAPHTDRGCGAQAWGETELFRVLAMLTNV